MHEEYEAMKQEIDEYNDSLPEYNSENSSNWIRNFIAKTLFDSKIDQEKINSCDEYIKKIISSSEFNYETDGEKKLSIAEYFIPILGEYKMVAEIVSGEDLVSGRKFSIEEQLVATGTLGAASAIGKLYKGVKVGLGLEESTAGKVSGSVILSMNGAGHSSSLIEDLAENATKKILGKGKGIEGASKAKEIKHPVIDNIRSGSGVKNDGGEHGFNDIIDNYAQYAKEFDITGGDNIERKLYQIEGGQKSYVYKTIRDNEQKFDVIKQTIKDEDGIFEWIVDPNEGVTHRRFIPGGEITGSSNQIPKK